MTQLQTFYEVPSLLPTDFSFLFLLLPLFLLAYYLVPPRFRPVALLGESLLFFRWAEPDRYLLLMLASVAADYALLRLMERFDAEERVRGWCLGASVAKNAGMLVYFGMLTQLESLPCRLGLPVYTLSAVGCLLAAWRREIPCERNFVRFALYCCFFPRLFAGPLTPYENFTCQLADIRLQPGKVLAGGSRYIQGAFKMLILGGSLYALYRSAGRLAETTALSAWLEVFALAYALYFLLSGFSDMARGLGGMFGIELPGNFYYPYQSRNVEDFFNRFNISVGDFFRGAIRFGPPDGKPRFPADAANILLTGALMGLWFGLRANYLLWGLYLALIILMEKYLYPGLLAAIPTLFSRAGTLCVVLAGFTIFAGETPAESMALIRSMLRFGSFYDVHVLYLLASNWLLLVVSCFFATNAVSLAVTKLRRAAPRVEAALSGTASVAILLLYITLNI